MLALIAGRVGRAVAETEASCGGSACRLASWTVRGLRQPTGQPVNDFVGTAEYIANLEERDT
jgi:hypothetical protein